jgi:tetratricopeptide (TPR) repeat protein
MALALAMRTYLTGDAAYARLGLQEAERAVAMAPDLPEAHQAAGRCYLALHRYREALIAEEKALGLRPDFLMALGDRADAWAGQGRLDLAWRAALDVYARDHPAWKGRVRMVLGTHLLDLGFDEAARPWLEAALYVEPQREEANEGLALMDLYQGRRVAGRRRLSRWVEADPGCRSSRVILGRLALLDGDAAEARLQLEHALALPGEPTLPRLVLATVELRSGSRDRARTLLREVESESRAALEGGSEWSGHSWNLAAVAALRNDPEAAADWYARSVQAGRRECRWDRIEPAFQGVRDHPAFAAALSRAEAVVAELRTRVRPVPAPSTPP